MVLIELSISGISYSQSQTGSYALILSENDGERKLPIVIGSFEAQAIAVYLEKDIVTTRPSTHDLFISCLERFKIKIKQVIIHKLSDGVFFSSLICECDEIEEIIDSRTSDAIALAIRFNAPIFTYENIMKKASFVEGAKVNISGSEDKNWIRNFIEEGQTKSTPPQDLTKASINDLNKILAKLVKTENYEAAAEIRDELSRRKKQT